MKQSTGSLSTSNEHGRFGKWLENARDWAISRNRYWGTPLPVWEESFQPSAISDQPKRRVVESIAELKEWAVDPVAAAAITDLHTESLKDIELWVDDERTIKGKRISEVLDCWFESGAMPYASFHYPFENKESFESNFPAGFISEGQDQTRGWFYTLHVLATALTLGGNPAIASEKNTSSFQNVIVNGIVLAEDGKKMSKRLKNYPDPMDVITKYGVDALRLYLMSSPVMKAENLNFSEKGVHEIQNKVVNMLWNLYGFYSMYVGKPIAETMQVQADEHPLDAWLLSRISTVAHHVTSEMDSYDVVDASRELINFVNEFSTWYLRLSRERIKDNARSGEVFGWTLITLCKLFAPFTPFISEIIYQGLMDTSASIHLQPWPYTPEFAQLENLKVEQEMQAIALVVERAHAARKEQQLKVRQPLASVTVTSRDAKPSDATLAVMLDEINVKEVIWNQQDTDLSVALDLQLTPELIAEGKMREAVRAIMDLRKKHPAIKVSEHVNAWLPEWPEEYTQAIKEKTLVNDLQKGEARVESIAEAKTYVFTR